MKKIFFTFLFILTFFVQAISQNVWENSNSEVHPFLYRMAQKGFIEYKDLIKPINRINVLNALYILKGKGIRNTYQQQQRVLQKLYSQKK